ncbi:MAG: threonylcarbamoyl-AMP synthase [Bacteroidetes bacterium]|nr:threonylcarbamoyl-AMP synthase [Bacteroidota bacterium]MBU1799142.1 threonylcarbamoyl-AMP synthase [Bacteroidota bacterium]
MIIDSSKENINKAAEEILAGGIVAFPTETVYGLGADGLNPTAVAKIFEAKQRPSFNPLILHISSRDQLKNLVTIENDIVYLLINRFWPGPLTLVLPKKEIVPDIVTAGNSTVAVRMPNHPIAKALIEACEKPIAAPSANQFGFLSPTTAEHVEKQLGDKVNIILDGGKSDVGVESTIVEVTKTDVFILRHGGISYEQLKEVCGSVKEKIIDSNKPNAPGQLLQHYAPNIPIIFLSEITEKDVEGKRVGGLFFKQQSSSIKFEHIELLSKDGDMREAAANLFFHLHKLESKNLDLILVEAVEEKGLGIAIMDRLIKATNTYK